MSRKNFNFIKKLIENKNISSIYSQNNSSDFNKKISFSHSFSSDNDSISFSSNIKKRQISKNISDISSQRFDNTLKLSDNESSIENSIFKSEKLCENKNQKMKEIENRRLSIQNKNKLSKNNSIFSKDNELINKIHGFNSLKQKQIYSLKSIINKPSKKKGKFSRNYRKDTKFTFKIFGIIYQISILIKIH